MVVAIAALVMACLGTAVAAYQLPRASVGAKHLKRNAVTGAKVKQRTLTRADINMRKLGRVPSARHALVAATASSAAVAASVAPPEGIHAVGAAGEPPFAPGAGNLGVLPESGFALPPVGFYKDREGIVHLEGAGKPGPSGVIFVLPPGYRPAAGTVQVFNLVIGGTAPQDPESSEPRSGVVVYGSNMRDRAGGDLSGAVATIGPELLSGITFRPAS